MRLIRIVTGAVFAAVITLVIAAAPASASHYGYEFNFGSASGGATQPLVACAENTAAMVCYQESGDLVWVYDKRADGRSAVAHWVNDGSHYRHGSCRNARGAGTWAYCNKNFPEGTPLAIHACSYDGKSETWGSYSAYINSLSCSGSSYTQA